jgi:hypothetical protein
MPGPKMGPRPADFDESIVRQSPTYQKWQTLDEGDSLRYACRVFVKGHGDDEERLMRRIMIARRNNLRDHDALKRARAATTIDEPEPIIKEPESKKPKRRKTSTTLDEQVVQEMDVAAVEATRSYKTWQKLEDGKEFIYNQKYIKGKPTHDWLLRKNIWRRMRYRRENKKMVQAMSSDNNDNGFGTASIGNDADDADGQSDNGDGSHPAADMVDDALLASAAAAVDKVQHIHKSVVDAAVAAAESYAQSNVHNEQADV